MSYYCCVEDCANTNEKYTSRSNYRYYPQGKFIKFPENPERRQKWNAALGLTGISKKYICSQHFADEAWRTQDLILGIPLAKRRLKADAVPTLKKRPQDVAENVINMDEKTRKRLVAEALESYEKRLKANESTTVSPKANAAHKCEDKQANHFEEEGSISHDLSVTSSNFQPTYTEKCGVIVLHVNECSFILRCSLCTAMHLNLDDFIEHIKVQHSSLLKVNEKQPKQCVENNETAAAPVALATPPCHKNIDNAEQEFANKAEPMDCQYFFSNDSLMTHIIYHYKKHSLLWDRAHASHECFRQRKAAIIDILHNLMETFPQEPLNYKSLMKILHGMRGAYRTHSYQLKIAQEHKFTYTPKYWFIEKLTFLDNVVQGAVVERGQLELQKFKSIASQVPYGAGKEAHIMNLIDFYEQEPSLWRINHADYCGKLNNNEKLENLRLKINEHCFNQELEMTTTSLREQLQKLNDWLSAVQHLCRHSSTHETHFPRLQQALEFLHNQVAPFECITCQRNFSTEEAYVAHSTGSSCSRKLKAVAHKCEYCGKLFAKAPNLKRHIRLHTNERPYQCNICGRHFRNYSTWFCHGRTHSKLKPHKCADCKRCFYTNSLLRLHQKTHLGIRDKVCDVCGKTFTLAKNLYRHRVLVHCEKTLQYQCERCQRIFKSKATLQRHQQRRSCSLKDVKESVAQQSNQVKTIVKAENKRCAELTIVEPVAATGLVASTDEFSAALENIQFNQFC